LNFQEHELGKWSINITDAAYEAHDLIPFQLRINEVVQLASKSQNSPVSYKSIPENGFYNCFRNEMAIILIDKINRMIEILNIMESSRRNAFPEECLIFFRRLNG